MEAKAGKLKKIIFSYRVKVTLVLILALFFTVGLSNYFIYKVSLRSQFNQLREQLMTIAQTAALMVDGESLTKIPLSYDGILTEEYKQIDKQLRKVKNANPRIKYIYTMSKTADDGYGQFIVDTAREIKTVKRGGPTAYPGDRYYMARFPDMMLGFHRPAADRKVVRDEWGVSLSGYAPIRGANGKPVALLGVDMDANDVDLVQKKIRMFGFIMLGFGSLMSVGIGFLISNRITHRIEKVVEGTRHIAADDLQYKVEVSGHDEIAELARSFNYMAENLADSRKKLQDYFYRTVQSLVRILEARDKYTRGHSERVAEYAQKLAAKMGLSEAKVQMLRKVGELHDIGKLAVQEHILNKKGPLNDEEWEKIREHPIIGEEILRPVFIDDDMLAMVRSHHERYDGTGYPDKIKGNDINLCAQIASVADAYDAMTSSRAYREAMPKDQAIEELKRHSGTQFNPAVVLAFLEVLAAE